MSARKRTFPKLEPRTVESIKIRKLRNQKYEIENNRLPEPENSVGFGLQVPELNLFENLPYDSNVYNSNAYDMNNYLTNNSNSLDEMSNIKIANVTSLNPNFETNGGSPHNLRMTRQSARMTERSTQYIKMMPTITNEIGKLTTTLRKRRKRNLIFIFAEDGTRYFPCHGCSSAYIKKSLLIKHVIAQHNRKYIVCKLCACVFPRRNGGTKSYNIHLKSHNKRFKAQTKQCPFCLFWVTPKCYASHLEIHTAIKKHVCQICKFKFRRIDALKSHLQVCHGVEQ